MFSIIYFNSRFYVVCLGFCCCCCCCLFPSLFVSCRLYYCWPHKNDPTIKWEKYIHPKSLIWIDQWSNCTMRLTTTSHLHCVTGQIKRQESVSFFARINFNGLAKISTNKTIINSWRVLAHVLECDACSTNQFNHELKCRTKIPHE